MRKVSMEALRTGQFRIDFFNFYNRGFHPEYNLVIELNELIRGLEIMNKWMRGGDIADDHPEMRLS